MTIKCVKESGVIGYDVKKNRDVWLFKQIETLVIMVIGFFIGAFIYERNIWFIIGSVCCWGCIFCLENTLKNLRVFFVMIASWKEEKPGIQPITYDFFEIESELMNKIKMFELNDRVERIIVFRYDGDEITICCDNNKYPKIDGGVEY